MPAADLLAAARELAAAVVAHAPLSVAAILDIERRTARMDPDRRDERDQVVRQLPSSHRLTGRDRRQRLLHREAPTRLDRPLTVQVS